jgi:hypothetical protein
VEEALATITRTEKRKRGFFGKIFMVLFWIFNVLMLLWLVAGIKATSTGVAEATSEAAKAGAVVGSAIGMGMIVAIWAAGAVILGLMVVLTPGKKIIVETLEDR